MAEEAICGLCGRAFHNEQDEWRIQIRNADSISIGPVDVRVCRVCADRAVDAVDALRRALV